MSYSGKLELKAEAIKLRSKGFSIKHIERRLKVSRSSVSVWVRDVILTKKQIRKLYADKKTGSLRGNYIASRNKIKRTKELVKKSILEGKKEIGKVSFRDKFIMGIALYFAEGTKSSGNVSFCNSDPRAISFLAGWFREICKVPEEKFRCYLYIHDNLNEKKAKKYWANLTGVPLEQFRKSYIVKNNKRRLRKVKHIYGILSLTVSDTILSRKIAGWMAALLGNNFV